MSAKSTRSTQTTQQQQKDRGQAQQIADRARQHAETTQAIKNAIRQRRTAERSTQNRAALEAST
eukprot:73677-Prymnesium_polylepis.1